jgi:hypothetical protein
MSLKIKHIHWLDGFTVRNSNPDFDLVASSVNPGAPYNGHPQPKVPEGEIWVDRRYRREKDFLLKVHAIEVAHHPAWSYPRIRRLLKRRLCQRGTPPNFVVRRERHQGLDVIYVRGDIVRRWIDPAFIFGGHHLVYRYIPKNEIWIDIRQDSREAPFTLRHEFHERRSMLLGASYNEAHAKATEVEYAARRRFAHTPASEPLVMRPYRQAAGFCGAASLLIAARHFGFDYDEVYLAKLCDTTAALGTDHAGLVQGAQAIGAVITHGTGGSIAKLRRLVLKERLPVIVGWYSRDPGSPPGPGNDHFSVVYHLTRTHVYLMDPEVPGGRRKMTIRKFLRLWYDYDTPENVRTDRWFMSVSFRR